MVLLALIVVVFLVGIILVLVNDKKNRLTGTWVYDSYTEAYTVFAGTFEAAFDELESAEDHISFYDLNNDSAIDFIVVNDCAWGSI